MKTIDKIIATVAATAGIPAGELNDETALYGSSIVSSLMMLEIMDAIEKEHEIFIRPEELIEDNFATIGSLAEFIGKKKSISQ
jgi:acyl carrier protein